MMSHAMAPHPLLLDDLTGWIVGVTQPKVAKRAVVTVELDVDAGWDVPPVPAGLPNVVVGTTTSAAALDHPAAAACDVVLHVGDAAALDAIVSTVERTPKAALALVALLREQPGRSVEEGLVAESRAYSELQGGPEFAHWLRGHERSERGPEDDPVRMERDGHRLRLTLARPHVRNALNAAMTVALLDGLAVAAADPAITIVELRGDGPAFCSGGDLDEFGTFESPEAAHALRLDRSVGRALADLSDRVVAHVHGPCAGSGIELPAFAGRVVATPDATLRLPEVAMGLIPGAGGTVSLTARIGRHRTARLALTGTPIDAPTALDWGLVDEIAQRSIGS
jgi:enoyl-CoA hydratase/carnithine racemase